MEYELVDMVTKERVPLSQEGYKSSTEHYRVSLKWGDASVVLTVLDREASESSLTTLAGNWCPRLTCTYDAVASHELTCPSRENLTVNGEEVPLNGVKLASDDEIVFHMRRLKATLSLQFV